MYNVATQYSIAILQFYFSLHLNALLLSSTTVYHCVLVSIKVLH